MACGDVQSSALTSALSHVASGPIDPLAKHLHCLWTWPDCRSDVGTGTLLLLKALEACDLLRDCTKRLRIQHSG